MKTHWRLQLIVCCLFVMSLIETVALIGSPAFSQVKDLSQSAPLIVLPTEIISATRYELLLSDLPVSATVITREEILNSPGRSIEELLRGVAGVQLPLNNSDVIFPLLSSIASAASASAIPPHARWYWSMEYPRTAASLATYFGTACQSP